jgi:hypothetical protein
MRLSWPATGVGQKRPWQYRLRTVFVITTIVALACGFYQLRIQVRARELQRMVEQYQDLCIRQRYAEARIVAERAFAEYPNESVALLILLASKQTHGPMGANVNQ